MKNIFTLILLLLLFSISTQAQTVPSNSSTTFTYLQVKNLVKWAIDSVRNEYKTADGLLITRLNNQNADRILLQKVVDSLKLRIKLIEDSTRLLVVDSSIRYVQGNMFDSLKNVFNLLPIQKAIDELSFKTGQDIEVLKQYMILQKKKYLELAQ